MYDYNPYRQPFNGYPQVQGNYQQTYPQRFAQQQCCCDNLRALDNVRYENAQNTCAITTNATGNTQRFVLINGLICASNCGTITTIPAPATVANASLISAD